MDCRDLRTVAISCCCYGDRQQEEVTSQCSVLIICSAPQSVNFNENNDPNAVVTTITVEPGVTLAFKPPEDPGNPFVLEGNQLKASRALDYETEKTLTVSIDCLETATDLKLGLVIIVVLQNLNDNGPQFAENPYNVDFNEMSPVGTTVGRFAATDLDNLGPLYYTLTSATNDFVLASPTNPDIIVNTLLDFDKVKSFNLVLTSQDTPLGSADILSFTATTTIMVTIVDVDNRPPWFQPCTKYEVESATVCQSSGYTGVVNLNEQEPEVLPLKPGRLHAIDGDSLNEEITYSFLSGNEDGLFKINSDTGDITMVKAAEVLGTITLTVLAAQKISSYQFATTSVTVSVHVKSLHPPEFEKTRYEAVVSSEGTMAVDPTNNVPVRIIAKDKDYAATGDINPYIKYSIKGSNNFSITDGYLFMINEVPDGELSLEVVAEDTTNDESATAQLVVDVKTAINQSGVFGAGDMAALGATLGVLLFVCLVVIGVLARCIQKWKTDCRKISEASMFQRTLSQGSIGKKGGTPYTNMAYLNDKDGGSTGSDNPDGGSIKVGEEPLYENSLLRESSAPVKSPQHDDGSLTGSEYTDSEKEVKPILTKERRMEEGYKSVWFKEDIDPNAKEEVVIIPDSREDDSEEEDDEDEDTDRPVKKVVFAEADLDSGLGVKIEDPAQDSDDDDMVTEHL